MTATYTPRAPEANKFREEICIEGRVVGITRREKEMEVDLQCLHRKLSP